MNINLLEAVAPRRGGEFTKGACVAARRLPGHLYRRILLATDFSPECEAVFAQGLKIAKDNQSELVIAHSNVAPNELAFMPHACYEKWLATSRSDTNKRIKLLIQKAEKEGIHCHSVVLTGAPESGIIAAAKKLRVDLIVIGTHARRGISRLVAGNVAMHVILHAPCSILIVRLPTKTTSR